MTMESPGALCKISVDLAGSYVEIWVNRRRSVEFQNCCQFYARRDTKNVNAIANDSCATHMTLMPRHKTQNMQTTPSLFVDLITNLDDVL
jgi:hypothetical protein